MTTSAQEIVVVGAGIVGVACALFLQEDGHKVTLVDPRCPGSGTSSGNAGVLSVSSVMPLVTKATLKALPAMLANPMGPLRIRWRHLPTLAPWLLKATLASRQATVERAMAGLQALGSRALQAHETLIQRAGAGEFFRSKGWLKVGLDRAVFEHAMATECAALDRCGGPYDGLDRAALQDLEPALGCEVEAGLWLKANREISHPQAYVERLARLFFERGGRHERRQVKGLAFNEGRVTGVLTTEGTLASDAVVVAAGAFSRRLAKAAGHPVPLESERGYHLMLPHPQPALGRPVFCLDPGFVLAPMDHGLRLTSGVELASLAAPPDFALPRRLLAVAKRYVPTLETLVRSEWQGFRPSLPDSLPVIGRARRHANVFLAFGHQHLGLTFGPITGWIVADLVAGRDPGLDLAAFRPDRRFF